MQRRDWFGLLNIAKPQARTSRDVVNVVQKLVKPAKAGHAGTLDPLATGVLMVCVGAATRLVPYVQELRKTYRAVFRLGLTSDTEDITGNLTTITTAPDVTAAALQSALQQFVGCIAQVPPKVSAVHVEGQRAYKLARQGQEFELAARDVEVFSIELLAFDGRDFTIEMVCSGGTYVRSIGRDVGTLLGCGAVMTELSRTAIGPFTLADAVPLAEITRENLSSHLLPAAQALTHLPTTPLTTAQIAAVRCGQCVRPDGFTLAQDGEVVLIDPDDRLIAVGEWQSSARQVQPKIVFPAE